LYASVSCHDHLVEYAYGIRFCVATKEKLVDAEVRMDKVRKELYNVRREIAKRREALKNVTGLNDI